MGLKSVTDQKNSNTQDEGKTPKTLKRRGLQTTKTRKKHARKCKEWEGTETTTNDRRTKNEKEQHYNKMLLDKRYFQ